MEEAAVRKGHAGVYIDTQDLRGLLGPAPGVEDFYLANGFAGHGFQQSHAIGRYLLG